MKRFSRIAAAAALLFTLLPLNVRAAELLVPGGTVIGLRLAGDSVSVAAYDEVWGGPARDAGVKIGDELIAVNGSPIACPEDVAGLLADSREGVELTLRRGGREEKLRMVPADTPEGPRLGIYLRQGIAGIGTVTFFDPKTHLFGTLGHGVSDSGGELLRMTSGSAYSACVQSVRRGRSGCPGQLRGSADAMQMCGMLSRNTPRGVFGIAPAGWSGEAVPTAAYDQIHTGKALIRSTVTPGGPGEYGVEILKIYPKDRPDGRNFLLRVTDPKLLETTGGIVQGMSGSPILQDGVLVGAVTHVLVGDSTVGYGIYIGNMLEAAQVGKANN